MHAVRLFLRLWGERLVPPHKLKVTSGILCKLRLRYIEVVVDLRRVGLRELPFLVGLEDMVYRFRAVHVLIELGVALDN